MRCAIAISLVLLASSVFAQEGFKLKDGDTLVFLGDSITQAGTSPQGYIRMIELYFGVAGQEVDVINAGISGHKSDDMLARLQKDVLDHDPTWVSVSCGVNDVWHQFSGASGGVPLEDYKKNMREIVTRIKDAGANVILLTATPIYEDTSSKENQMLDNYNTFLRELAKEEDLLLADLSKAFHDRLALKRRDENLLTTDGVHMNPRGNRLMARTILQALGARHPQMRQTGKRWELIDNL